MQTPSSPTIPTAYNYSSLPSSPSILTSPDILTKTSIDIASPNSEQYLHHKRGMLENINNSGLPVNIMKNSSSPSTVCSRNTNYDEENLMQLDDSPKHRIRARKPKIIRKEPFTLNIFNYDNCKFQDEIGFSAFGAQPAHFESERILQSKDSTPRGATRNNTIITSIQKVANSNTINSGANYSGGILETEDGVGSNYSTEDIQNPSKIKATSELVCTSRTAIFPSPRTKPKIL